jgi:hypothetical protein
LLRSVPVEALDEHVYVIEENPGIQEEWTGDKVVWAMHDQQTAWSKIFLSEENSFNATVYAFLVSMTLLLQAMTT